MAESNPKSAKQLKLDESQPGPSSKFKCQFSLINPTDIENPLPCPNRFETYEELEYHIYQTHKHGERLVDWGASMYRWLTQENVGQLILKNLDPASLLNFLSVFPSLKDDVNFGLGNTEKFSKMYLQSARNIPISKLIYDYLDSLIQHEISAATRKVVVNKYKNNSWATGGGTGCNFRLTRKKNVEEILELFNKDDQVLNWMKKLFLRHETEFAEKEEKYRKEIEKSNSVLRILRCYLNGFIINKAACSEDPEESIFQDLLEETPGEDHHLFSINIEFSFNSMLPEEMIHMIYEYPPNSPPKTILKEDLPFHRQTLKIYLVHDKNREKVSKESFISLITTLIDKGAAENTQNA